MIASYRRLLRRAVSVLILIAASCDLGPARADSLDGTELIRAVVRSMIGLFEDKALSKSAREENFRAIYRAHFDHAGIAARVVGRSWQQASADERQQFHVVFEAYVARLLAAQLAAFPQGELKVPYSQPDGDTVVVWSEIVDPRLRQAIMIKWRLRNVGSAFKVQDVFVENVSLSLHFRREFAAILRRCGTIDCLNTALRERIVELDKAS